MSLHKRQAPGRACPLEVWDDDDDDDEEEDDDDDVPIP